jgi:cyclopropane-fatty-acyl-phospholipid synthase
MQFLCFLFLQSIYLTPEKYSIENVENIGIHYYPTLRYWRKNLLERQKQIIDLGFDEKFLRTWEYYFDYCAAGFKTLTLRNYQVTHTHSSTLTRNITML